jgi:hypothetical protein
MCWEIEKLVYHEQRACETEQCRTCWNCPFYCSYQSDNKTRGCYFPLGCFWNQEEYKQDTCVLCCYLEGCVEPQCGNDDERNSELSPGYVSVLEIPFCLPCVFHKWFCNAEKCYSPCWYYNTEYVSAPALAIEGEFKGKEGLANFARNWGYTVIDKKIKYMPGIKVSEVVSPVRQIMSTQEIEKEFERELREITNRTINRYPMAEINLTTEILEFTGN